MESVGREFGRMVSKQEVIRFLPVSPPTIGCERRVSMINRREFGAGLAGMAAQGITRNYHATTQEPRKNTLMHVGGDYHSVAGGDITSKQNLEYNLRHGVKLITYHWEVIPYRRNGKITGRGGTAYDSFKLENDWKSLTTGDAGRVTHDDYWERIAYFLEKIIPAAKENDVKMACHPYDPPGLPFGYQGVDQWDSPAIFEAIKRYESIVNTPYNGFQLDLGTTAAGWIS